MTSFDVNFQFLESLSSLALLSYVYNKLCLLSFAKFDVEIICLLVSVISD